MQNYVKAKAKESFQSSELINDKEPYQVFISTYSILGVGLMLIAANKVFLLEPT
jgi:SNF2 family DNA or RNA helicase